MAGDAGWRCRQAMPGGDAGGRDELNVVAGRCGRRVFPTVAIPEGDDEIGARSTEQARDMSSVSRRSLKSRANPWLVGVLLVLVSTLLYQVLGGLLIDTSGIRPVTPRGSLSESEQATIEIYRSASRSVVHIETVSWQETDVFNAQIPRGVGSGIVWDKAGHIVTNLHVLDNATLASVTLPDKSVWQARTVGIAHDLDIAVLKIDAAPALLTPIAIGRSKDLQVGQLVLAIGNPFGLDQTLTTGVISGLGRQIQVAGNREGRVKVLTDVIQTDAAINPGNSGGPLLDSAGRLLGVNTLIYSNSGNSAGVGFAVPVDRIAREIPQILAAGTGDRPGLGVTMFSDRVVRELVVDSILPRAGVLVRGVIPQGAAQEAGMQPTIRSENGGVILGDLIIMIDGQNIEGQEQLFDVLEKHSVGDKLHVRTLRGGQQLDYTLILRPLPIISQ